MPVVRIHVSALQNFKNTVQDVFLEIACGTVFLSQKSRVRSQRKRQIASDS